jgi:hypothetical protein
MPPCIRLAKFYIDTWAEMRQTLDGTSNPSPVLLAPAPRTLGALSALILLILVVAGLAPFHPIPNHVSWLKSEDGPEFGEHGVIFSAAPVLSRGSVQTSRAASKFGYGPD